MQYMNNFQLQNDQVKHVRVLLYGPVGAGKSSFINSVSNVLRRRMTSPALNNAANHEEGSFTKKVCKLSFIYSDLMC